MERLSKSYDRMSKARARRRYALQEHRNEKLGKSSEQKSGARATRRDDWQWQSIEMLSEDTQSKSMAANRMATQEQRTAGNSRSSGKHSKVLQKRGGEVLCKSKEMS